MGGIVTGNTGLVDLTGLELLRTVSGTLTLKDCPALSDISALHDLTCTGGFVIYRSDAISKSSIADLQAAVSEENLIRTGP
jgi:hypothetical protein